MELVPVNCKAPPEKWSHAFGPFYLPIFHKVEQATSTSGSKKVNLPNLRLGKSDSLAAVVKFRHNCERGFESNIVGCHCQWFVVSECISGEFISLRVKKTLILHSCLPLHYRALREKVDEIAFKPAGTKQETVK